MQAQDLFKLITQRLGLYSLVGEHLQITYTLWVPSLPSTIKRKCNTLKKTWFGFSALPFNFYVAFCILLKVPKLKAP